MSENNTNMGAPIYSKTLKYWRIIGYIGLLAIFLISNFNSLLAQSILSNLREEIKTTDLVRGNYQRDFSSLDSLLNVWDKVKADTPDMDAKVPGEREPTSGNNTVPLFADSTGDEKIPFLSGSSDNTSLFYSEDTSRDVTSDNSPSDIKILNYEFLSRISSLYLKGDYQLALARLLARPVSLPEGISKDEQFSLLEQRQLLLIQLHYRLADYSEALPLAREYFKNFSNGLNSYQAYYLLSSILYKLNLPLEYTSLVSENSFYKISPDEANKLRVYLIQDALNKGLVFDAFSYLKGFEGDRKTEKDQWVQKIVAKISTLDQVEELLGIYDDPKIKSELYMKKAKLWIDEGRYLQASDYLSLLAKSDEFAIEFYSELLDLQAFLDIVLDTNPYKIGVVLPFTHRRFKTLAYQVRDGLELALQDFDLNGRSVQLVFKDSTRPKLPKTGLSKTRRTRQHIKKVVQELVEQDNVIAILGPLAKNTSLAAGEIAELYRIPVISFSLTENIGRNLPYLFRFQRSRDEEAKALAKYAMDYLNAKRFVLLYPAGKTGFNSMKAFSDIVSSRQGKIVGISRVLRKQVDFQEIFKSITGGYRKISEEEKKELEKSRERPTPIVDFDAIYTPFAPSTLNLLGSFLNLFDAEKIWMLGNSRVNVKENQRINYSKRLRFVDTFAISNEKTYLKPFFEAHWRNYNFRKNYSVPTAYTFYGYEALELLIKLLNNPQNRARESLKKALTSLRSFPVLTGNINKKKNGELNKELKILKLKGKNTVPVF